MVLHMYASVSGDSRVRLQLMAEEKRKAKMMEKMKEREETLKHMQNYGMGGDGRIQQAHKSAPCLLYSFS